MYLGQILSYPNKPYINGNIMYSAFRWCINLKKKKKNNTYDWFLTQVNIFHLVFIFYFRKQFLIGLVYKNNPSVHSLKCNTKQTRFDISSGHAGSHPEVV